MRREERPNAIIVHRQGVQATACRQGPNFDGLVRGCRHDGVAVLTEQDVSNIIRMTNELGDASPSPDVPHPNNTLRTPTGNDSTFGPQCIDGSFAHTLTFPHINLKRLPSTIEIPKADSVIQSARGHPCSIRVWGGQTLDIVAVNPNGLRCICLSGMRSPYLDRHVRRSGYECGILLGQDNVIDPMCMRLYLAAKLCRARRL
jgi:hypothetical protein